MVRGETCEHRLDKVVNIKMLTLFASILTLTVCVVAAPSAYSPQPYAKLLHARQATNTSDIQVDLGYSIYQGASNASTNLNVFKGIRFAAAPTGTLRWQAPAIPTIDRAVPLPATSYGSQCPQSPPNIGFAVPVDNSKTSEDCLFLNVWSPNNVSEPLPVFVWIHGGGYGTGSGQLDLSTIINTNGNRFVGVTIQYRLGAFGFLASDELYRKGVVNAGLLDQNFALQWVQQYISQFNGDPQRVTIAGESAGGGSVMLQAMAYGGTLGESLFTNVIAASPYLPMQYGYADWVSTQSYFAFANAAGCFDGQAYGGIGSQPIFECLVSKESDVLINASALSSPSGVYGSWAFLPVTDGTFVEDLPSRQLLKKKTNGLNILSGNNANEGPLFVPQDIKTVDQLVEWLRILLPGFTDNDIAKVLLYYSASNATATNSTALFATIGDSGPSALNQSNVAVGQQQTANNIYAESVFVCPSYWLAEAFSDKRFGQGKAYKYQYSVLPALHGNDVMGYFGSIGQPPFSDSFSEAFQQIWGNFIINNDPSISQAVAVGQTNSTQASEGGADAVTSWPAFSVYNPYQIDLNQTGGTFAVQNLTGFQFLAQTGEGAVNDFRQVNAYTWEDGRGTRCDFWRSMGEIVPE